MTRYLFSEWDEIKKRLQKADRLLLLLDYDGTLAPIASIPQAARLPLENRRALRQLVKRPQCRVGVVSGRSLSETRDMVGVRGLILSGNHGLEIQGAGLRFSFPGGTVQKQLMNRLANALIPALKKLPGVWVEDKKFTLSIHYRLMPEKLTGQLRKLCGKTVRQTTRDADVCLCKGKKVLEIRPTNRWNKGLAISWIKAQIKPTLTLYVGDDVTDRDAFQALAPDDIAIRVGPSHATAAPYFLKNQAETNDLLGRLATL